MFYSFSAFASVLIPGGTINLIVRTATFATTRATFAHAMPTVLKTWFPTITGLVSIPLIVHPIDSFVDLVMNNTTRKWFVA
jgi:fission process protein 1